MAAPTSIKDTRVKRFSPTSLSDSLDATDEFPGACSLLSNLVPDPSTRNVWTCRPGAVKIFDKTNFAFGGVPTLIDCFKVVGSNVYGIVENPGGGSAQPFAWNLLTNSQITVTAGAGSVGSIGNQLSNSGGPPACFATWVQPTMDLVGVFLIVTHPMYISPAYIGWFDLTNPLAPTFTMGNTAAGSAVSFSASTGPAKWVCQFGERAYYGVGGAQPAVWATDVLALKITNASQVLTFNDNLPLTAAAPLPLSNQLGGIIQALMVFKGITNIYQITGDFATTNLTINTLNVATGTLSPRAIARTPLGLMFVSPDGARLIDQNAQVSDPIGLGGQGITLPFFLKNTVFPALTAAGCDATTLRISVYTGTAISESWAEYWYNIPLKVWSGPHSLFSGFQFDTYNGTFLSTPAPLFELIMSLYSTDTYPSASSVFTEYSTQMTYTLQSAVLEDNGQMAGSELAEMQVVGSASANNTMTVKLLDPNGATINTSTVVVNSSGLWPYRVDFPAQAVFNRAAVSITGNSAAGVRIGDTWMRLKTLGYIPPPPNPPSS